MVRFTLQRMATGGIYDHLGGGFGNDRVVGGSDRDSIYGAGALAGLFFVQMLLPEDVPHTEAAVQRAIDLTFAAALRPARSRDDAAGRPSGSGPPPES